MLHRHLAGEVEYFESTVRVRHRDGSWVWVLSRGRVMSWTADGKPKQMFGTHVDITQRIEQGEALRVSIGMSVFPIDKRDPESALRHGERALYQAKAAGRATCRFYDAPAAGSKGDRCGGATSSALQRDKCLMPGPLCQYKVAPVNAADSAMALHAWTTFS
jgi:hypothetical protein